VVAILATDRNDKIEMKCKCVAEEVQKLEPTLTGFRVARTSSKDLKVGGRDTFALVDDEVVTVVVQQAGCKEERIRLMVKPPSVGEITYSTCCGKFFPIITRYQTKDKDKDRLIIAIRVEIVGKKEKEK